MNDNASAQTLVRREIIDSLNREFAGLHSRSCTLINKITTETLYQVPSGRRAISLCSVGESVLRSAAIVEQTFDGITTNLWDDPFEWTLPETLSTPKLVVQYLFEVEETRERAFASFAQDGDLSRIVVVPSGERRTLISLLLETLVRATEYQGRAHAALNCFPV